MRTLLSKITGAGWLAFGAWFIGADLLEFTNGAGFAQLVVLLGSWGFLALCVLAGALLLSGHIIGKWLVTSLAVLLVIYAGLLGGKAEGAPIVYQIWCATTIAFAIWSVYACPASQRLTRRSTGRAGTCLQIGACRRARRLA